MHALKIFEIYSRMIVSDPFTVEISGQNPKNIEFPKQRKNFSIKNKRVSRIIHDDAHARVQNH